MLGVGVVTVLFTGGYMSVALVSISGLLNPTIGLLANSCPQSVLLVIMFQFLWIMFFDVGVTCRRNHEKVWICESENKRPKAE